jgi:hypothetical protein
VELHRRVVGLCQLESVQPLPAVLLRKRETERKVVGCVVGKCMCEFNESIVTRVHDHIFGYKVPILMFVFVHRFLPIALQFGVSVDAFNNKCECGVFSNS